jgi:hypothetical protein
MESAGLAGVEPSFIYLYTDDTRSQVKAVGYLDQLLDQGIQLSQRMTALVMLQGSAISDQKNGIFNVRKSGGKWSLVEIAEASPASWIFAGGNTGDGVLGTDGKIDMEAYDVNNGQITLSAGNELRLRGWPAPGPSGADFIVENFAVSTIHGAAVNIANLGSNALVMGSSTCTGTWNGSTLAVSSAGVLGLTSGGPMTLSATTTLNINAAGAPSVAINIGNGTCSTTIASFNISLYPGNSKVATSNGLKIFGLANMFTPPNWPITMTDVKPLCIVTTEGPYKDIVCIGTF